MHIALLLFSLVSGQFVYPVPEDVYEEPHIEMMLIGVVEGESLKLLEPIDIALEGAGSLSNIKELIIFSWSDPALSEISKKNGMLVRAHCIVTISTFLGYRHAACNPIVIEPAPNNSFKPNPHRGGA